MVALALLLVSAALRVMVPALPPESNTWFSASGVCVLCHSTSDYALRDPQGNDVSPVTGWRSTMLANAAKDPFWKAKVRHEGNENPSHREALENVCTRCHAPMGMVNALMNDSGPYTLGHLREDEMGRDGISCTVCHQFNAFTSPLFSGNFDINRAKEITGPYENPVATQMILNTGYTPVHDERINDSRLCGVCHTLLTHSVDEHGEFTGHTFVEQALYHEWENSVYAENGTSCQSCHMPRIDEVVKISSRPGVLPGRQPFGPHYFTGGNLFMLNLLKDNHDELQLHSGTEPLMASIGRTEELLTLETIDLQVVLLTEVPASTSDSLYVEVRMKNKAGHKFPTGFPSRRAFLEVWVTSSAGTHFHSGRPGSAALINSSPLKFEPHHEVIRDPQQVQIYEFVMGNTRGEVTTVLEKAYVALKDNRMVPEGFQTSHANYDTVKVVGRAADDPDYLSGKGIERVVYAFPAAGIGKKATIKAILHYETAPESWLRELFDDAGEDENISSFKTMYDGMTRKSTVIAADSLPLVVTLSQVSPHPEFGLYPNPSTGRIRIEGAALSFDYAVYSITGTMVGYGHLEGKSPEIDLHLTQGLYYIVVYTPLGKKSSPLVVR